MKQLVVISAVGTDRPGVVHGISQSILECGGNIVESRMSVLGSEFAMLMLVSGTWHTIVKLESDLPKLGEDGGLFVNVRRTKDRPARDNLLPYAIDVVCLDQPGIVANLARFFASRDIEIAELITHSYSAAHTGAPMFSVQMSVNIPSTLHISTLREEFMDFCDQYNLDAILEPVKA